MFPIAQRYIHSTVLVTDEAIDAAQLALWDAARLVAEPAGATAFAACTAAPTVRPPASGSAWLSAARTRPPSTSAPPRA